MRAPACVGGTVLALALVLGAGQAGSPPPASSWHPSQCTLQGAGTPGHSPDESPSASAAVWLFAADNPLGRVFHDGAWATVSGPHGAAQPSSGSDEHGPFSAVACNWTSGLVPLITVVKHYAAAGATVYTLTFPTGASQTNASVPGGPPIQHTKYGISTDSVAPFAEFPSFDLTRGRAANASWFTWVRWLCPFLLALAHVFRGLSLVVLVIAQHGGLQYRDTATGTVQQGRGFRSIKNLTGLTSGPIVLFDESTANATFPTAGTFSQIYGSILTVILHINGVPCCCNQSYPR